MSQLAEKNILDPVTETGEGINSGAVALCEPLILPCIEEETVSEPPSLEQMNYSERYSDSYYENYIESFQKNTKKRYIYRFVKRTFDIGASALALLLLSPVFLVTAIAIKCDSKGPIIFKQPRVGKNGKIFCCLKFRSMRIDAPKNAPTSQLENPEIYYTKVGRFLRKTSIDEFPQFWCVFVGKMSFIGYRPLVPNEVKANEMRKKLGVFEMRPGISGHAQVLGRDNVYYKNKAILDAEYVKHASLWFDLKLIVRTVLVVFNRKGNSSDK
ncbi:MAG: sugar transferase [Clostridia bacterium]|nr:sugar transferase [Clostridia bacterium]